MKENEFLFGCIAIVIMGLLIMAAALFVSWVGAALADNIGTGIIWLIEFWPGPSALGLIFALMCIFLFLQILVLPLWITRDMDDKEVWRLFGMAVLDGVFLFLVLASVRNIVKNDTESTFLTSHGYWLIAPSSSLLAKLGWGLLYAFIALVIMVLFDVYVRTALALEYIETKDGGFVKINGKNHVIYGSIVLTFNMLIYPILYCFAIIFYWRDSHLLTILISFIAAKVAIQLPTIYVYYMTIKYKPVGTSGVN